MWFRIYIYDTSLGTQRCQLRLLNVTTAVYPHLVVNYDFSYLESLESSTQAKKNPLVLPSFPIKIWGKSVKGFISYDRTSKQTNTQTTRRTEITTLYLD